jgi:hypothetical protein
MDYAPGTSPRLRLEEELDLEVYRRLAQSAPREVVTGLVVKLKRENQLLRAALLELANEP